MTIFINTYEIKIQIRNDVTREHVFILNLLYIFESIAKYYCEIIVNDENKFLRRLNDVDITF